MATVCCSIPSITEVIGMFSLGNHELRLYRTCKVIHVAHQVRREWWQHLQLADSLAWHLDPSKAQRAWDSFFAWQRYVHGDPLPVAVLRLRPTSDDEDASGNAVVERVPTATLEDYPESDDDSRSSYSYSSCPDRSPDPSGSEFSDEEDPLALYWLTGFGPRGGPPCAICHELPSISFLPNVGRICARCKQDSDSNQISWYWCEMHRNHRVLRDFGITRQIVDFIWGDGLSIYCYCGQCDDSWFLHGWVCYDRAPLVPVVGDDV